MRGREARDDRAALNAAMDRYAMGDAGAFSEIYDVLAPRLHAFARKRAADDAEAEDLVQQTLLQMHCARETYVTGGDVLPWAYAILRRLAIDARRRRAVRAITSDPFPSDPVAQGALADAVLEGKETAATLARALERLPGHQRAAYELVKEEGLSTAEAAEVLGTTVTAVKLRMHRTYEALRDALARHQRRPLRPPT